MGDAFGWIVLLAAVIGGDFAAWRVWQGDLRGMAAWPPEFVRAFPAVAAGGTTFFASGAVLVLSDLDGGHPVLLAAAIAWLLSALGVFGLGAVLVSTGRPTRLVPPHLRGVPLSDL